MAKAYIRKQQGKGFAKRTHSKRGCSKVSAAACMQHYLALSRYARSKAELEAQKACDSAARVSAGAAPCESDLCAAGVLCFRGRSMASIVLGHIYHREQRGDLHTADGLYNTVVPWTSATPFRAVLACSSVHSCFKTASPGSTLAVDLLTRKTHDLVNLMKKRGLSADEQVKAAALCAYAISLPVVPPMRAYLFYCLCGCLSS